MDIFSTSIPEYYENSIIFVVGGTGLLGSLLVEKLLRTCTNLKKIYILIRPKKNITSEDRFRSFFDRPIFEKLKATNSGFLNQVVMISGDCSQPNLGLSNNDLKTLSKEVNCIFYSAANLNFEAKFRISVATNVAAVRYLFGLAKKMQNLKSIVYVSTAYFYGMKNKDVVYEKIDDINTKLPEQLENLCDYFDDKHLEKFKSILVENDANIYSTTKWAAEILIKKVGEGLPVAVVRPSMITPTLSDPVPGWIDNFYGPIGAFTAIALGVVRVAVCKSTNKMDLIPADYVTNCMLASAIDIYRQSKNESSTIKIYNCVTSSQNPVTYGKGTDLFLHYHKDTPYSIQVFYDKVIFSSNIYMYCISKYMLCIIPAHIIELMSYCMFKPISFTAKLKKLLYRYERILTFPLYDWNFRDDNVRLLWQNLKEEDKMRYNFDVTNIDWNSYHKTIVEGVRVFLLKDPIETVPRALKQRLKLKIIFYSTAASIFLSCLFSTYLCFN